MSIYKTLFTFAFSCLCFYGQTQQSINLKLKIRLNSSDEFQHHLNECSVLIFKNSKIIDSLTLKGHVFKYRLSDRSVYKVLIKKNTFISKHIIVNTTNCKSKRFKLKADLGLFHLKGNENIDFLDEEPVSIAYYNGIKKEIMWDFEYNRSIVEKIIHAQIKE